MMMTSMPYFILMKPNTLEIINAKVEMKLNPVCFTLDAGAQNLYPENVSEKFCNLLRTN
jgi:diphosphomevalonate decarboxylase